MPLISKLETLTLFDSWSLMPKSHRRSSSGSRMLKHFDDDGDTQTLTLPTIERSIVELILIPPTTATYYKRSNAKSKRRRTYVNSSAFSLQIIVWSQLNLNEKPSICIPFNGNIVQLSIKKKLASNGRVFFSPSKYWAAKQQISWVVSLWRICVSFWQILV